MLDEIRSQPPHIREIFMWACVVIVFSVVGFVWFRSTSKQFVALLHPEEAEERALAEKNSDSNQADAGQPSPFATIFESISDLRANISELLTGSKKDLYFINEQLIPKDVTPPHKLPILE